MKTSASLRPPTPAERDSLTDYIFRNRAFDPLAPTRRDARIAEEKVSRAHMAVFDSYPLEPGWPYAVDKLLVVVWDDNPEHVHTFVFDRWGQVNRSPQMQSTISSLSRVLSAPHYQLVFFTRTMPNLLPPTQHLQQAVARFPYPLELLDSPTGRAVTANKSREVHVEQGCVFVAGHVLDEEIVAAGWLELEGSGDDLTINAAFAVFLGETSLLSHRALKASYDAVSQTWGEFYVG